MPRQSRQPSKTGIYHLMLRGINQQNIFEDSEDFWKFIELIKKVTNPTDPAGHSLPPRCIIYAYCLMTNHVHLLIREQGEELSSVIKTIGISYAIHYNKKYQRKGPLFQDRFKSEPVNDIAYFITLLRYIHQNPIAADLVKLARDYTWSSYREYEGSSYCAMPICNTKHVFARIPREELLNLINTPLSKALKILDIDTHSAVRVNDDKVRIFLLEVCKVNNITQVQYLPAEQRDQIIHQLRQFEASIRQLSRMTGISIGIIRRLEWAYKKNLT